MTGEEAQKVSPHNVPLLLEDYLELMAIKNLQVEDKPLPSAKLPRNIFILGVFPTGRVITKGNFYLSGEHLITQHPFFLQSREFPSCSGNPQAIWSVPQLRMPCVSFHL